MGSRIHSGLQSIAFAGSPASSMQERKKYKIPENSVHRRNCDLIFQYTWISMRSSHTRAVSERLFVYQSYSGSQESAGPFLLTLPMLRLLLPKAQGCKLFWKIKNQKSKPCHVGIHWIALTEYSKMSTHLPGLQSFFRFFGIFCIGQIGQQHKG